MSTSPWNPDWPVLTTYDQDHTNRFALPLGGIGTGTVSLGGRGNLLDWEIMNRPAKGYIPMSNSGKPIGSFLAVYAKEAGKKATARGLEGPIDASDYEGRDGCMVNGHGIPRFRHCEAAAAYPFGQIAFQDDDMPVTARLEAFNPMVPTDADASGHPAAVIRVHLTNTTKNNVTAAACFSLPNFIGDDGTTPVPDGFGNGRKPDVKTYGDGPLNNYNEHRAGGGLEGLFMKPGTRLDPHHAAYGTMAVTTTATAGVSYRTSWKHLSWGNTILDFWDEFSTKGKLTDREQGKFNTRPMGSLAVRTRLAPGKSKTITFILSWHFPNRVTWTEVKPDEATDECCEGGSCCEPKDNPNIIGNYYATQYADAWHAAAELAKKLPELEAETITFVNSLVASDLPSEVIEAALYNTSTLRTQTCFRTPDGRFYGWEGCGDQQGCCHGSCTHVWNYEVATPYLYGALARTMREVEFAYSTDDDGRMSFRVNLPLTTQAQKYGKAAADGQLGCLMKLYREWQLSGDDDFLKEMWPHAKRALEFCWIEGGWDGDKDGVMEGCQHNTMDVEYYGPNPQMGVWYLGALRAMEEMATYLGEDELATVCKDLFQNGSKWLDANLFNGEYYEHEIRPAKSDDDVADGLKLNMGGSVTDPILQLGSGCLVDQLVGQFMAEVCGLGKLTKTKNIRKTLKSLMTYNFKTGFYDHFNHMRSYVVGDESAMLMATYPKGRRPAEPFPYYNEVMTGFEYSTAVHMLYEGMEEGMTMINAIRDRYDGKKRSPFNEAECGHHYARAMASWGAILALTGFSYSGVEKHLTMDVGKGQHFWSTGDAYGTLIVKKKKAKLNVLGGELALAELTLSGKTTKLETPRIFAKGQSLSFKR